jgi:hypothetical protein
MAFTADRYRQHRRYRREEVFKWFGLVGCRPAGLTISKRFVLVRAALRGQ